MPARKNELRPDAQGRYRPYLGWKIGDDGVRRQHRFNLGANRKEADSRMSRLRELWHEVEKVAEEGDPIWTPFTLYAANLIAEGRYKVPYPFDPSVSEQLEAPVAEYAQLIHVFREWFPSLDLVPAEPELYAEGLKRNEAIKNRGLKDLEHELRDLGVVTPQSPLPEQLISGTLHEAFDAYTEDIKTHNVKAGTDRLTLYGRGRLERVKRFKQRHPDIPLSSLSYDACKDMIRHWLHRPLHKRTGMITGKDNARHHIGELHRFFGWLELSNRFAWTKPRGIEKIDRTLQDTDEEKARKLSAIQKDIYSIEELAILNRHATPIERLVLYLGVNCAMGAAELGRLRANDFLLFQEHAYATRLNFSSTKADSFLRTLRPKTMVFGEWILWPETVEMIHWGIARRNKIIGFALDALLLVSESGASWYSDGSTNPQARFTNVWNDLIKRVQKEKEHKSFRRLPFGTLRDTLPDIIRHRYDDELASLCLAHGKIFTGDTLLDCYANRPFGRLHKAIRELHEHFAPMFAAAPDDPVAKPRKRYTSLGTQERILELLAQCVPVVKIAAECGVDRQTVYRIRDQEKS